MRLAWKRAGLALAVFVAASGIGRAESVEEFYRGRTVELYVGFDAGGGYDSYARVLAAHIGDHIPGNPTILVKNMPGAGSLKLMNFLATVAPKDGSVFGTVNRGMPTQPLLGGEGAEFDARKMSWIGSVTNEVSLCVSWHTAAVKTWEDLQKSELIVGGTGPGADTDTFPRLLGGLFGAKFKLITGYPGGSDILLAMERGEVAGRCGWSWSSLKSSHADWLRDKKLNLLAQLALEKSPDLPDVPLIMDLAATEEQKQVLRLVLAAQVMARPFVGPPDIPADRLEALRTAFMDTMRDPAFLEEASRAELEVNPVTGAAIERLVGELYATSPAVVARATAALKAAE